MLQDLNFAEHYGRFQELVSAKSGHSFADFESGLAAVWESYKPRLRSHALQLLCSENWSQELIGSGDILSRVIKAIEIQDSGKNLINNLVFWQNRFGHSSREHRILLEAISNPKLREKIELALFAFFRTNISDEHSFEKISELTGYKYPLTAYLFFLKDINYYMPIQPTGFDRIFNIMGIDFSTRGNCNWNNYTTYNSILRELQPEISVFAGIQNVKLIDAHSFCWIYSTLLKQQNEGALTPISGSAGTGTVLGGWEKRIVAMTYDVQNTVKNSNGQVVEREIKNKELRMTRGQLEEKIRSLLSQNEYRCALTGLKMIPDGDDDKHLRPSVDRIDSNGHYEEGNIQIVCRFINFWKSDTGNDEFTRLLNLVRGHE